MNYAILLITVYNGLDKLVERPTTCVPEPGTFLLLGGALIGLYLIRRRR